MTNTAGSVERIASRLASAWNSHDLDALSPLFADAYVGNDVAEAGERRGPQGVRDAFARYYQAFPDLSFTITQVIANSDHAALVWLARGTHRGPILRIPPTGRVIEVWGTTTLTIADDKITEARQIWDVAGLLRQIRLLPEL